MLAAVPNISSCSKLLLKFTNLFLEFFIFRLFFPSNELLFFSMLFHKWIFLWRTRGLPVKFIV